MTLTVSYVPPHVMDPVWPKAGALLLKSLKYARGRYEIEDVYRDLVQHQQQLWIVFDDETKNLVAAITTRIAEYPHRRMVCGYFLGGTRLDEWADLFLDVLEKFEKDMGCDGLEFVGRKGWEKVLAHRKIRPISVIYERIDDDQSQAVD
jgi:hypothetical protein